MTNDLYSMKQLPNSDRIVVWSDEESAPLTSRSIVSALNSLRAENDQLRARLHGDEQTIGELRERVDELTAELAQARAALRPFAVMGNVYKQYSEGVWGETVDYGEDESGDVQRVVMADFTNAAAVYQQLQPATAGDAAGSEEV